jgi:hypothetical protein
VRGLAIFSLAVLPFTSAIAQHGPELGVDLASVHLLSYQYPSSADQESRLRLGGERISVGFFLSPRVAIEPAFYIAYDQSDGAFAQHLEYSLSVPIYFRKNWGRGGFFIAPEVAVISNAQTGGYTETQFSYGIGVGAKVKLAGPVSLRVKAVLDHALKDTTPAATLVPYTSVALFGGIAVFLK